MCTILGGQCLDYNKDYGGSDISWGYRSGLEDCYNHCKATSNCKSFTMVYRGTLPGGKTVNHCWIKSKTFSASSGDNDKLVSANMNCFIGLTKYSYYQLNSAYHANFLVKANTLFSRGS